MSILQIILTSFFGAAALVSIGFIVAFIIEISVEEKEKVFESAIVKADEESVEDMLAKLDEQTVEEKEEVKPEEKEVEVKEESAEESTEEELTNEEVAEDEVTNEETAEVKEENTASEPQVIVINENSNIDYEARLAQVIENKENLERELAKVDNAILKYDRTARRMERNQKMLDRRASELTNLNLVMYSVTDIKNVDEDKKVKQEELTAHIAELKASIQDAEEFLESNKEKNEHNVKMAEFLRKEIARYEDEIVEIKKILEEKAS